MDLLSPVGLHKKDASLFSKILQEVSLKSRGPAGAIASFIGIVREDPVKDTRQKVTHLDYEAYDEIAVSKLSEIRADLLKRDGVIEVSIHHVIDRLAVGEASLFVVVAAKHRKQAFRVLEEAVERVKREVTIWKKEVTEKESYWVTAESTYT